MATIQRLSLRQGHGDFDTFIGKSKTISDGQDHEHLFGDLPFDVLLHIFSHMNTVDVLRICSTVNKNWRIAAKSYRPAHALSLWTVSPQLLSDLHLHWPCIHALKYGYILA